MRKLIFINVNVGATGIKSINLTSRRFVSNKRIFTEFEEDIYDARDKRLCLNNRGSDDLPDDDSINSSLMANLEVNINESEYRPNNPYRDEIVFYVNRLKELREIMAKTQDPCDKVKTLDELDRQEDALLNFVHSNIRFNPNSERELLEKLIEAGQDEFLYNWKGHHYLWTHYPDHRWPIPEEELWKDTSDKPEVEEENSPSEDNISSQDNDDDDDDDNPSGDLPTSGDLSSGNNWSGGENLPDSSSSKKYYLGSFNTNLFSDIKPESNGSDFISLVVFHLLNAISLILDILTQIYLS